MIEPIYSPLSDRYEKGMKYSRCGRSGILLSEISLGFWQNFGEVDPLSRSHEIMKFAFDHGVTSFDLANNYGPSYGTAEETFGYLMKKSFLPFRDEMFIASKAGYDMWPGPYGNWGSRKYLFASLHQSLKRMNIDYVDVFYSHRFDPETPLDETLQALVDMVRQGKVLYVGISRWPKKAAEYAFSYLKDRDTPCLLFQDRLNILDRKVEESGVLSSVVGSGAGFVSFSPLAQGLLTSKYLHGIPAGSRATKEKFLRSSQITPELQRGLHELKMIAEKRGQTLAQMSLSWVLQHSGVNSVIVGCSSVSQLEDSLKSVGNNIFESEELNKIDEIAANMMQ